MMRPGKRKLSPGRGTVIFCIVVQFFIALGLFELYTLTGWFALQPLMLLMLIPALVQAVLLLPKGATPDCQCEEVPQEQPEEKPKTTLELMIEKRRASG